MNLCSLLGIELPVIQAPMAGVQDGALARAVSGAGGLGSLPCAMLDRDTLFREAQALKETGLPFNLNFFCHVLPEPQPRQLRDWHNALATYFSELGIDPDTIPAGPGRRPFDAAAAEVVEAVRPAVVSFHFGLPKPDLLSRVKSAGAKVLVSATTVEEARWLEEHGADAIIAQGLEAGGHRGLFLHDDLNTQMGTFALLPQVVAAVNVPVIAAGGIASPASVRAAMQLGAAGVQAGSAYLLCPEATTGPLHREALQSPAAALTAVTNVFTGRPARGIVNRIMRELGPISPAAPDFPLATTAVAALRRKAEASGSSDFTPLWAGQNLERLSARPAADITRWLAGMQ
ncbi:NAD(P)H-dependent flavin oxidoreductase [Gilvimarinus sp. F26214L]|uniref:NAD(P)H-dependent flavin oxidoreductase n=1 Tax=Gilvimarinus sp. DZF01 TaxID=3461371 RepID=UPI0040466480